MKYPTKIFSAFILTLLISLGSCTTEDPVSIKTKSFDQFLADFGTFVKSEKALLDTCTIGYGQNNFTTFYSAKFEKIIG